MPSVADDLNEMQHDGTTNTMTHDGEWWGASEYRQPAAKARADVVSGEIIAAAIEVHRQLGPGLLESVYRVCPARELGLRGIDHRQEAALPVTCKGLLVEASHRIDLLVEDLIIVELKSVERLEAVHKLQLLTYLRLSGRWMGLLVNFNTNLIKNGLRRMLND